MKLRHIFLSILLIFSCMSLWAQHVYVEAGGASTTAGVHYDSRFNDHTRWGGRIGVAYTYSRSPDFLPSAPDKTTGWSFPVAVNYLIGGSNTIWNWVSAYATGYTNAPARTEVHTSLSHKSLARLVSSI